MNLHTLRGYAMGYLEDFSVQINNRDFSKFMQLWEEYCTSDRVEASEFIELLKTIKTSDFAKIFGQFIEMALPLWKTFEDSNESFEVLRHLIDLQTTNTPLLADTSLEIIKNRYGDHPQFNERLRLIGLRNRENFQGALSNYALLDHVDNHKFVFHTGGWGTGEIIEVSLVREQLSIEFEHVSGKKHVTFMNAFKMLIPLSNEHFLSRRFSDPDKLESEAKKNPVDIVKSLLRDLGPKTAADIKDELSELVIPEDEWAKWWQGARAKLKKDSMVKAPDSSKDVFSLRKIEFSQEDRLAKAFHSKTDTDDLILASYNLVRDLPKIQKKQDVNNTLKLKLLNLLEDSTITPSQELQILILLEDYFSHEVEGKHLKDFILEIKNFEEAINPIEIVAIKKKALNLACNLLPDWVSYFSLFLQTTHQSTLRDYIVKELKNHESGKVLNKEIKHLIAHPFKNPDLFMWYFQKETTPQKGEVSLATKNELCNLLEAFFILLSQIEVKPEYKELTRKMYTSILAKRYALIRQIIEGTGIEFIKEFLLLVSKCQTLTDHDLKILRSLAEVVHPSLAPLKEKNNHFDPLVIWTTEAGYLKTQERAKIVGTIEIIENAKEIEAARALGDLRENSEYKFALEKRSRLQSELKTLSDQLKKARLITPNDISLSETGVGCIIELEDNQKKRMTYTILGPWEADPDKNTLSFQSKLAQAMCGLKVGETFTFRDEEFQVLNIKSYLSQIK